MKIPNEQEYREIVAEIVNIIGEAYYDREFCNDHDWNAKNVDDLDAFYWNNSVIIDLLDAWEFFE